MERPEDIRPLPGNVKGGFLKNKQAISIIIWFHLIGLIGLSVPFTRPLFVALVPYHLLLMVIVIILNNQNMGSRLLLFVFCLFILGYGAEWLGVNKHLLFGEYHYGRTLGFQLFSIPVIIGLNWFLLIYSAGVMMQHSRLKSMLLRVVFGALLLVLLDILIEPVAVRLDYWQWTNNIVPLSNYYCWFFVSAFMLLLFEQFRFKKQSSVAPVLLITEFVFFATLLLSIH